MSDDYTFTDAAIESLVCPYCLANPGQPCRTVPRNIPAQTHGARWQPLAIAWGRGYEEAESGLKSLRRPDTEAHLRESIASDIEAIPYAPELEHGDNGEWMQQEAARIVRAGDRRHQPGTLQGNVKSDKVGT